MFTRTSFTRTSVLALVTAVFVLTDAAAQSNTQYDFQKILGDAQTTGAVRNNVVNGMNQSNNAVIKNMGGGGRNISSRVSKRYHCNKC